MSQKINFSDYNASGVYFLEIDNSIVTGTRAESPARLAVGFNARGPFNRPIYLASTDDCDKLLGGIDKKLERRGCFTNRNIRTMISKTPIYAINLLNVDTKDRPGNPDKVGFSLLSLDPHKDSSTLTTPFANMYDRTKFWIADETAFVNNTFKQASAAMDASVTKIDEAALFGIGNCGTKDISVIIRKAENMTSYNVTFLDYFGSEDNIPYPWINKNDFVSDYFVDVFVIAGNWSADQFQVLAGDAVWSNYFTAEGVRKDNFKRFIRLDAVNLLAQYTGCILPNFTDKQGVPRSIDYLVNSKSNETGLIFAVNEKALDHIGLDTTFADKFFFDEDGSGKYDAAVDTKAIFNPDMVGHCLKSTDTNMNFKYFSANVKTSGKVFSVTSIIDASIDSSTMFTLDASNGPKVNVGDYVRGNNGMMCKILKKRGTKADPSNENSATIYRYTVSDVILDSSTVKSIEVHKPYQEMYETMTPFVLTGLTICNRHIPGFDASGNINNEAGVEKIYAMLEDPGIRKGLLNDDEIDFRYVVDTMAFGLGTNCGAKEHLAKLAMDKKHCTALINAPSISQFAASDAPFFGPEWDSELDPRPTFDVSYIPGGGNQDMIYPADVEYFSLPDTNVGADHVGVFSCYLKYAEGVKTVLVPPAADVSNTFMNKFTGGDPYKTVANRNGVIRNSQVTGVEFSFDETDRGYLEKFGINPLISRDGEILIYGDRTAYQIVDSDLNFLHVRELLNTIQISCKKVLQDYVFTYNVPTTRAEICTRINPILQAMKDSNALVKFEIECDEWNNTKEVIDNKFCIIDIGVWITQNMEKIVVPITLNRSTTAE